MDAVETAPPEDPFAGDGGPGADDPFAADGKTQGPPPIVDKEGQPVDAADPDAGRQVDPPAPAPAAAPDPAPAADPDPAPAAPEEGGEAAVEPKKGTSPMRHYHILYQTAPNQWTEHEWEGDDGKPQKIIEARNNDHALRQAFQLLGSPENGVTVLPVPVSAMKPKRLKPKAVMPRTALDISSS